MKVFGFVASSRWLQPSCSTIYSNKELDKGATKNDEIL